MAPRPAPHRHWPGGLVGTYALHLMSEGPIYGGELAQRIEDATRGAWRPGPGAIYPILAGLTQRGDARVERLGGRKVYALTARGASRLEEVRRRIRDRGRRFAELRSLVLEMVGPSERAEIMVENLRRSIDGIVDLAASPEILPERDQRARLARRAQEELTRGLAQLRTTRPRSRRAGPGQ